MGCRARIGARRDEKALVIESSPNWRALFLQLLAEDGADTQVRPHEFPDGPLKGGR